MVDIARVENWRDKIMGPLLWLGGIGGGFGDCMPGVQGCLLIYY